MAKTKAKESDNSSFFEEEKPIIEAAKMSHQSANNSNSYKNTLYKYKDNSTCRVVYDGKDPYYVERTLN